MILHLPSQTNKGAAAHGPEPRRSRSALTLDRRAVHIHTARVHDASDRPPEWNADRSVDHLLATKLIRGQFPALTCRRVEQLSEGWDYVVFRVDDDWVFRFPRRAVVVPGTERELATLPILARRLPVPVPEPLYVGHPVKDFPWPFYGCRCLPGLEACGSGGSSGPGDTERATIGIALARALRHLHDRETLLLIGNTLPFDPLHRADMQLRVERTRISLEECAGLWDPPTTVDRILNEALQLPPPRPSAVCHGDLHFRQFLVEFGELRGIVDWVDVCRSDPGVDLQLYWSFLPTAGRRAFLEAYGPASGESLLRARVIALYLNAILLRYGHDKDMPAVEAEALAGLRRTAEEDE